MKQDHPDDPRGSGSGQPPQCYTSFFESVSKKSIIFFVKVFFSSTK